MKKIFLFIVLIRALATIVITNSHYTGVYPTDLIANGGLLGDVLFFAVSGYCLANTKGTFGKWYLKRFVRVYVPVWVCTFAYMLIGVYVVDTHADVAMFFLWPTHWHFVASIILLYIPLFFVAKHIELNTRNYWRMAVGLLIAQLLLYLTIYDASYYHIDNVREPMIEFLFFQAMLLGLHYRWQCDKQSNGRKPNGGGISVRLTLCAVGLFMLYFASKMLFVKMPELASCQMANQVVLLALLFVLFKLFMLMEGKLKTIEGTKLWKAIHFVADRTLEIYLVQYVILDYLKIGPFPLNWLLLTTTILLGAIALRWLSQMIIKRINL